MRNVLATIAGLIVASLTVYIFESLIGHSLFPLPEGSDPMDLEWIKNNMDKIPMGSKIFVIIAHLVGIITGMFIAAAISKTSMIPSYIIGFLIIVATFFNIFVLPKELWFSIADGLFAFLGLCIGTFIASKKINKA